VPRLCEALARSGFIALIHWSDAMRDRRLVPEDAEDIACAYASLITRADVDRSRSGLYGTCVGGTFALLAAAQPLIRDRVAFVGAFAPFSSMWTLARDIASGTRDAAGRTDTWTVDRQRARCRRR
jgi:dienelactone hydrolase